MILKSMIAVMILSASVFANNCEEITYSKKWIDYPSKWNESCANFIKDAMTEGNCSELKIKRVNESKIIQTSIGSSLMCVYHGEEGIYQVMASQMAEPHQAILLFSKWD